MEEGQNKALKWKMRGEEDGTFVKKSQHPQRILLAQST